MSDTLITSLILLFIIAPILGCVLFFLQRLGIRKIPDELEKKARILSGFSAAFLCLALTANGYLIAVDICVAILGTIGVWILVLNDCCSFNWWQKCVKLTLYVEIIYISLGLGIANVGVKLTSYLQISNVPYAVLFITILGYSFVCYGGLRNYFR